MDCLQPSGKHGLLPRSPIKAKARSMSPADDELDPEEQNTRTLTLPLAVNIPEMLSKANIRHDP